MQVQITGDGRYRSLHVTAKLGNMRKEKDFVVYPVSTGDTVFTLQSDNRIACVKYASGRVVVSDGKGGHQGFHKLNDGSAKEYACPVHVLDALRPLVGPPAVVLS